MFAIKKIAILSVIVIGLSACTAPGMMQPVEQPSDYEINTLPNWYHDSVGFQMDGGNDYPMQPALAKLLREADIAFIQNRLAQCQILLERAQRIATRESAVYVRLSYLYWVQQKNEQAVQMARRALAVLGSDVSQKKEVKRLLDAIQKN